MAIYEAFQSTMAFEKEIQVCGLFAVWHVHIFYAFVDCWNKARSDFIATLIIFISVITLDNWPRKFYYFEIQITSLVEVNKLLSYWT